MKEDKIILDSFLLQQSCLEQWNSIFSVTMSHSVLNMSQSVTIFHVYLFSPHEQVQVHHCIHYAADIHESDEDDDVDDVEDDAGEDSKHGERSITDVSREHVNIVNILASSGWDIYDIGYHDHMMHNGS